MARHRVKKGGHKGGRRKLMVHGGFKAMEHKRGKHKK